MCCMFCMLQAGDVFMQYKLPASDVCVCVVVVCCSLQVMCVCAVCCRQVMCCMFV